MKIAGNCTKKNCFAGESAWKLHGRGSGKTAIASQKGGEIDPLPPGDPDVGVDLDVDAGGRGGTNWSRRIRPTVVTVVAMKVIAFTLSSQYVRVLRKKTAWQICGIAFPFKIRPILEPRTPGRAF